MRSIGKRRTAERRHWFGRDGWRALVACLCLAPVLAIGAYLGSEALSSNRGQALRAANGDDELKTGSILFVAQFGDRCRRRVIDNATWLISDNGSVDCGTALAQARASTPQLSSARVDVIRNGFRAGPR